MPGPRWRELWQLVPALLLSGAGWAAMSGAALNLIVAPWFERDRPRAISTAFNGASIGGLLFAPLWTVLIAHVGLEAAGAMVAIATVTIVCPLAWLVLSRVSPATASKGAPPMTRRALLGQPGFRTLSAAFALGMFVQIGLFAHLIARLEPAFGPTIAALAISLATLCAVLGRSLMGRLLGGHDRRFAAAANFLVQAVGTLLLALGEGIAAGPGLCAVRPGGGQCHVATAADRAARIPAGRRRHRGGPRHGDQPGGVRFAPVIFGGLRDATGAYPEAFLAGAVLQAAAAGIIVLGRRFS